jgi:hypothetical protein
MASPHCHVHRASYCQSCSLTPELNQEVADVHHRATTVPCPPPCHHRATTTSTGDAAAAGPSRKMRNWSPCALRAFLGGGTHWLCKCCGLELHSPYSGCVELVLTELAPSAVLAAVTPSVVLTNAGSSSLLELPCHGGGAIGKHRQLLDLDREVFWVVV